MRMTMCGCEGVRMWKDNNMRCYVTRGDEGHWEIGRNRPLLFIYFVRLVEGHNMDQCAANVYRNHRNSHGHGHG